MKRKRCRNVHSISVYKTYVFITVAHVLWLLWQLKSFYCAVVGKMKICIYCYLVAYILTKVFQKCLLSSPLSNI